jgi:hypothetical protein
MILVPDGELWRVLLGKIAQLDLKILEHYVYQAVGRRLLGI